MSVEEHLWFYARIKGIPKEMQSEIIETTIKEMSLTEHRLKPAGTLSGGNKRKLSVAMAIIGNPPIILLDEPSAGMDPEARRFMWSVVANISQRDKQSAVILTTHSMEEARPYPQRWVLWFAVVSLDATEAPSTSKTNTELATNARSRF